MRFTFRVSAATAVIACSVLMFATPSQATGLPSGSGVLTLIKANLDGTAVPGTATALVANKSTAMLPCMTAATSGPALCSDVSGAISDGTGDQMLLTDVSAATPNASGLLISQPFPAVNAFYAQFDTQSYGFGGGARTLWLINSTSPSPTIPSRDGAAAYGDANGGLPGAVLGITFDAAGDAASTNDASCPSKSWSAAKSKANQVVVRSGDTSLTSGSSGYCFIASTAQPLGSLSNKTASLGPLHQSNPNNGWQRIFVSLLPPSFTSDQAELTIAVDAADGQGLVTVLDIALPTWAWPTDQTGLPASLRAGISAMNPTSGTDSDVVAIRDLQAVAVAPAATVPTAPRGVGVQWSNPINGVVDATVSWTAPQSSGYRPITAYTALVNGSTCTPTSLTGPTFSCVVSGVPAGDTYAVTVTATNEVGDSDAGVTLSRVNAQSQTITLPTLNPVTFGTTPLRVSPVASSGLTVTMSASGACTWSNGQLTFAQAGVCTVTATQPGTLSFEAAPPVTRTIQVAPATATIKVSAVSTSADGAAHPVSPSVTPAGIPLVTSYCPVATPTQCSPVAPSAVGSYIATVRVNSANYSATPAVTYVDLLPSLTNMPPEAGGPASGTNNNVVMKWQPLADPTAQPTVVTSGSGFTPGSPVAIAVTGQESVGSFTIPPTSGASSLSGLLSPSSSNTTVGASTVTSATTPSDLSDGASIAYPFGGFPGAGDYILFTLSSSGFVPGTTVSTLLHSSPIVMATATANSNGVVTITSAIPAAFAGQSHKIVIAGTYLASTTNANADGSVSAQTAIPNDLLSRLEPSSQITITAIDQNNPSNFAKSYINLADASIVTGTTTTTVAGSANDVLNAPPLNPTDQPQQTMKQVTSLVAVAATVAATASVAASAAASVGSIRVPSGGAPSAPRSSGGGGGGSSGPLSTQQIGVVVDEATLEGEALGDKSKLWRAPGRGIVDRLSVNGPKTVGPVSPMLAAALADGSYLRAIFGSLSSLLPIFSVIFAIFNVIQSHGYPVPGNYETFTVMMVLGALDGWAGLASTATVLVGAIATGHIFKLHMVVSFSLMAALLFGTAIIVKGVRPLVRDSLSSFQDRWKRAGDLVVGPLFGGFLATQLVGATASAAGLQLPITNHALFVGAAVGIALFARYLISTFATIHFPKRLSDVTVDHLPEQKKWAKLSSQIFRQIFTALLLQAFLGWSWVLGVLVMLQVLQAVFAPRVNGQLPKPVYRVVPRGVVNMFVMATIGTLGGRIVGHFTHDGFWQVAGLLLILGVVNLIYAIVSSFDGEGYPVTWSTRLAGLGAVIITGLQLTGRLI